MPIGISYRSMDNQAPKKERMMKIGIALFNGQSSSKKGTFDANRQICVKMLDSCAIFARH
jgi:hypothetical protein